MGKINKTTEQIETAKRCLAQFGENDADKKLATEFINAVDTSAKRTRQWLTDKGIQITNVREFFETIFPNIISQLEASVTTGQRIEMQDLLSNKEISQKPIEKTDIRSYTNIHRGTTELTVVERANIQKQLLTAIEEAADLCYELRKAPTKEYFEAEKSLEMISAMQGIGAIFEKLGISVKKEGAKMHTSYMSEKNNRGGNIYYVGETHCDPASVEHLKTIVQNLDSSTIPQILFILEPSFNLSEIMQLSKIKKMFPAVRIGGALETAREIATQSGIQYVESILNGGDRSVLEAASRELQQENRNIDFVLMVGFNALRETITKLQAFRYQPDAKTRQIIIDTSIAEISESMGLSYEEGCVAYRRVNTDPVLLEFLGTRGIPMIRKISDAMTEREIGRVITANPECNQIVCIAGANHLESVKNGLKSIQSNT